MVSTFPARVDRERCIREAGEVFAEAYRVLVELPVEESARRAFTPTGPSLAELEAGIRARVERAP